MAKLSKFQIVVLCIFGFGVFAGLASLALFKNNSTAETTPSITVWGVLSETMFNDYVAQVNTANRTQYIVNYIQKNQATFERELTEELALGKGPDAVLIPQELLLTIENKLVTIPYTTIGSRDYKNTFIEQAELYLRSEGSVGIPFVIDPMVMYWNRDTFTNAGIATYPKTWDDFLPLIKKVTQKDVNSNIRQSAVALGEFSNIVNARDIFSLILLQAGNPIVSNMRSTLGGDGFEITGNALKFFTGFSNPSSPAYSWNRSLPLSKNYFISGNLATYFGFAGEVLDLRDKNPNLNFDIAPIPQPKNTKNRVGYGRMYGFSIVKSSKDPNAALTVLTSLTSASSLARLVDITYLPPVRRDLIAQGNKDPYLSIFYDAALISKGWLDPSPYETAQVFQNFVESVTSGREIVDSAINQANNELTRLLQKR